MKIHIEVDPAITEDEIVIKCSHIGQEVVNIQQAVQDVIFSQGRFVFYQGEKEFYLSLDEIMFFETDGRVINAHTRNQIYQVRFRLYELEGLLPSFFVRVAKSTIVNIRHIRSINRNLTGASEIEFAGTPKSIFVSRGYYKMLKEKLDERRALYETR